MPRLVKPYGDTQNDGKVQLSFTLPVEWSEAADEAARHDAKPLGIEIAQVDDIHAGKLARIGLVAPFLEEG